MTVKGPDPRTLTDDDLASAANLVSVLAGDLAGIEPTVLTAQHLTHLAPGRRWVIDALRVLWDVLRAEDERRTAADARQLVDEVERYLTGR